MHDDPAPSEILDAAAGFLRELAPGLSPELAFKTRVLTNALSLVARQIGQGDRPAAAARSRLAALAGRPGEAGELQKILAERIEQGAIPLDDHDLLEHLWATTLAKIAVDQPSYASYRAEIGE